MKPLSSAREWLRARPNLSRIGANAGWLLADKAIRMPISLGLSIWIARYLGPAQMGMLGYATAIAGIAAVLASLGIDSIAVRRLVETPEQRGDVLGTTFVLKLIAGLVALALATGSSLVLNGTSLEHWLVVIIAAGTIFQSFDTCDYWFQARVQLKFRVLAQAPVFVLLSATKVVLLVNQAPLIAFAWVALAEIALGSLALALAFRVRVQPFSAWRFSSRLAKSLLADSWPFAVSAALGMVYLRIDQVFLAQLVGDEEVGVYAVAVRLAELVTIVSLAIHTSMLPSIVEAKQQGDEVFHARMQRLYNLMAFVGYAFAIPVTVMATPLITSLFGEAYVQAAPILIALAWGSVFMNLGIARSTYLTATNWTRLHLYSSLLATVANVLLNLWLIPRHGGFGAAIASVIAYWIASQGACFLLRPLRKTAVMMTRALIWPRFW